MARIGFMVFGEHIHQNEVQRDQPQLEPSSQA